MTLIITGAAGFIGSCFLRLAIKKKKFSRIVIVDSLTYAGRMENIESCLSENVIFEKVDITNFEAVSSVFKKYKPQAVAHLAAESHVDNSISGPRPFIETNIIGTFNLLEAARALYTSESQEFKNNFKFLHISTDEVFGELGDEGFFHEEYPYSPNSPYSASKASSDHLVRAWHHTYKLPTIITNCSNNYGPRQFPEKLIPKVILNCLSEKALPVYGTGSNIRDWIHVEDHSEGVWLALTQGEAGGTYCLGGRSERTNLQVVKAICAELDKISPRKNGSSYADLITFVEDRAGHDFRYAIDDSLAAEKLNFKRAYPQFEDGLVDTIRWYLDNNDWIQSLKK